MPCDATCAPAVFLFHAKGVCFLATATRRLGANDTVRLYSDADCIPGTPVDLARPFRIYWQQHGFVCRPQAKPHRDNGKPLHDAPKSRAELKGAPVQIAFISTHEFLAQLLENMSSPALPNPTRKGRNPIGRERGQTRAIAASITPFHVSVVIEPHPAVEGTNSSTLLLRTSLSAQCRLRGMDDRSMITTEIRSH